MQEITESKQMQILCREHKGITMAYADSDHNNPSTVDTLGCTVCNSKTNLKEKPSPTKGVTKQDATRYLIKQLQDQKTKKIQRIINNRVHEEMLEFLEEQEQRRREEEEEENRRKKEEYENQLEEYQRQIEELEEYQREREREEDERRKEAEETRRELEEQEYERRREEEEENDQYYGDDSDDYGYNYRRRFYTPKIYPSTQNLFRGYQLFNNQQAVTMQGNIFQQSLSNQQQQTTIQNPQPERMEIEEEEEAQYNNQYQF